MWVIESKQSGFRRCGIAHPEKATGYPDDHFSDEQLDIIMEEDMLTLSYVDDPEPPLAADPFAEVTAFDKAFYCAIDSLDEDKKNKVDWTKSGVPQVKALEEIMGESISAGLRDTAWKLHEEAIITKATE